MQLKVFKYFKNIYFKFAFKDNRTIFKMVWRLINVFIDSHHKYLKQNIMHVSMMTIACTKLRLVKSQNKKGSDVSRQYSLAERAETINVITNGHAKRTTE